MPKRSNLFQDVVQLVFSHLSPGANIRGSAELVDEGTGQLREVDTVIDTVIDGVPMIVSIESRGRKRAQTIEFIDEMYGKHRRLATNLLILVSKNGFTGTAAAHAHACTDLPILLVAAKDSDDLSTIPEELRSMLFRLWRAAPKDIVVEVAIPTGGSEEVTIAPNILIFSSDGSPTMDGQTLLTNITNSIESQGIEALRNAQGDETHFSIAINVTQSHEAATGNPLDLNLQTSEGELRKIQAVTIAGSLRIASGEIPVTHASFQEITNDQTTSNVARYVYGRMETPAGTVTYTATERPDGTAQSTLQVD